MSAWVYLYDEDELDRAGSERQLRRYGVREEQLLSFSNRIDLFEAIDARSDRAVALIDLQSDDQADSNYSGHRVVETIRRHPRLRELCTPLVYTVHVRDDVIELARRHGGCGLISKIDLDVPEQEGARIDLLGFLAEQRERPPDPFPAQPNQPRHFPQFPDVRRARERMLAQDSELSAALVAGLASRPKILFTDHFWQAVRYFAEGTDPASVARWISADRGVSQRTVEVELDDLRDCLAPKYKVHGIQLEAFARDLLARVPHKRHPLAPEQLDSLRVLQRVSPLEAVLRDSRLREESYLDEAALAAIDRVVDPLSGVGRLLGKLGASYYTDDLLERLTDLEPNEQARTRLQADLVRGVTNMYDTYLAHEERVAASRSRGGVSAPAVR
jgi:hypothetical protein